MFWALIGGGGSTWGIIYSITIKMHFIPEGGFTVTTMVWQGDNCLKGQQKRKYLVDNYFGWMPKINDKWGGLYFITPVKNENQTQCKGNWTLTWNYVFLGS